MGARLEDYAQVSPYKSFLHVDQFAGPRELAEYLLELDKEDEAYNQYFKVRKSVLKIEQLWYNLVQSSFKIT